MERFTSFMMIGWFFLAIGGANAADTPDSSKPQPLVAQDRTCKVVVPVGWTERPLEKSGYILRAWVPDSDSGATFCVLRIPKEDLAEDVTYLDRARRWVDGAAKSNALENAKITKGPTKYLINGRDAVKYEMEAVDSGSRFKIRFEFTVVDGKNAFFDLGTAHLPSEAAKRRQELDDLINSFEELP